VKYGSIFGCLYIWVYYLDGALLYDVELLSLLPLSYDEILVFEIADLIIYVGVYRFMWVCVGLGFSL
jgi:hypothetical protein